MHRILPFGLFLFLASCVDHVFPINDQGAHTPIGPAYVGPLIVEFRYANSLNFPGYVRFINQSRGMVYYEWDMGIKDASGKPVVSYVPNPNIRYPANGFYMVTLKARDREEGQHVKTMLIQVTNL